uniref:Glycosyltransferase family 92 protein n=1 Tax=Poecilia latipinna TaxID=48699 RepID=A0A3B3TNN4_9TELE
RLLRVKGSRTLLISAYVEHRTTKKEVRVIAIKLRREKVVLQCLLRCQDQQLVSKAAIRIHRDHFRFPYGTADVLCPVPSGCEAPTHVAIAPAPIKDQGNVTSSVFKNTAVDASASTAVSCFHSFNVNIYTVSQLVQNLEMLQLLGVNRVVVYKTNCSADVQRVLDYYSHKGLVEVIPWSLSKYLNVSRRARPSQSPGDLHYFGQIPALNDCLYRSMYRSRYVALHDLDELILPQSKKYGADRCYLFENNWIPTDQWQNVSGVNILAHLYREPIVPILRRRNFKVIVNPRAVFATSVHGVLKAKKSSVWVNRKIARMYHIKPRGQTSLKPQSLIYEGRLLSYSADLTPAVNAVLRETRLLQTA